jgi:hypothetical protein
MPTRLVSTIYKGLNIKLGGEGTKLGGEGTKLGGEGTKLGITPTKEIWILTLTEVAVFTTTVEIVFVASETSSLVCF